MDDNFDTYIGNVLDLPSSPSRNLRIGSTEAEWWPVGANEFHVIAEGGTRADRLYAEAYLSADLEALNLRRAYYDIENKVPESAGIRKEATWAEVAEKAKRLIQGGKVTLNRNGYKEVHATVEGDHGTYEVDIKREDPNSRARTQWTCTCPWGQVSWGRTRKWKRFEGRSCSHSIAAYWLSLATPLDEDIAPGGGQPQGPQGSPPQPQGQGGMVPPAVPQGQAPMGEPGQYGPNVPQGPRTFDPNEVVPGQAMSEQSELLPPFQYNPEENPEVNPISIPGQKEPSPLNPLQMPGTWSHVRHAAEEEQPFVNGEMVSNNEQEIGKWVGLNGGDNIPIPKNSVGEVLGTEGTGAFQLVNVYFAGPAANNGPLEPHGATAWIFASQLRRRPDVKPPGPAVRRSAWSIA